MDQNLVESVGVMMAMEHRDDPLLTLLAIEDDFQTQQALEVALAGAALSPAQLVVARAILTGQRRAVQIARSLGLSPSTVRNHWLRARRKLNRAAQRSRVRAL